MDYYPYEAFNSDHVKKIRIPQQTWLEEDPAPAHTGIVDSFDLRSGNGYIKTENGEDLIFFNFTAIPGEGYRTLRPSTPVKFNRVDTYTGVSANQVIALE